MMQHQSREAEHKRMMQHQSRSIRAERHGCCGMDAIPSPCRISHHSRQAGTRVLPPLITPVQPEGQKQRHGEGSQAEAIMHNAVLVDRGHAVVDDCMGGEGRGGKD